MFGPHVAQTDVGIGCRGCGLVVDVDGNLLENVERSVYWVVTGGWPVLERAALDRVGCPDRLPQVSCPEAVLRLKLQASAIGSKGGHKSGVKLVPRTYNDDGGGTPDQTPHAPSGGPRNILGPRPPLGRGSDGDTVDDPSLELLV